MLDQVHRLAARRPVRTAASFFALAASAGLTLGAAPAAARTPAPAQAPAAARPNILVILMDDLGARDVGYGGSTFYETPAIDQLARDGLRFDNAYVAYPRCTPSRFAFFSGRNPARAGVPGGPGGESLPAADFTIAEALKASGYGTYFLGKWHLGKTPNQMPDAQGFDVNIGGGSAGAVGSHFFPYGAEKGRTLGPGLEQGKPGEYLTDRLTDETIGVIENHLKTKPGQPFFTVLSHYAVHTPLESKPEYRKYFADKLAKAGGAKPDAYLLRDGETKKYQDNTVYAGMTRSMDDSVAKLRAALTRLKIADNTIVIFTSDHGGLSNRAPGKREVATSNLPLRAGKGHVYEGGTRVPMVVLWPGHTRPGSVSHDFVANTDHYATLLQIAGGKPQPQQAVDSVSYATTFNGGHMPADRPYYWYSPQPRPQQTGDTASAAMRLGNWKFVRNYDPKKVDELFDLAKDPGENTNLAASDPARAAQMKTQLEGWLASIKAVKPALDRPGKANKKAAKAEARRAKQGRDRAEEQTDE